MCGAAARGEKQAHRAPIGRSHSRHRAREQRWILVSSLLPVSKATQCMRLQGLGALLQAPLDCYPA